MSTKDSWSKHEFAWAPSYRLPALALGIMPATTGVELGPEGLRVKFGLWRLQTTLDNIADVQRSGDFAWIKTVGPPHLSFTDRGVTFATNGADAVCVSFHKPVAGIDPTRRILHPGATITVADPARFIEELKSLQG